MKDKLIDAKFLRPDGDIGGEVIELWEVTFLRPDGTKYIKQMDERDLLPLYNSPVLASEERGS
ncbi:hypothetical protein P8625_46 [Verrucomicrobia phage P8625]|uniref:hypothetical protein n=1 Tax=Verrucomicrobia phage P8625 TaxID=1636271 RepID=UPI0005FEB332|nr:hypothetical protein AWI59_gp46 [Verrucomicrobia phage P8625]AKA60297.1 hypothetical protein P8625_46 [Verrucomicrobia phage P8625]